MTTTELAKLKRRLREGEERLRLMIFLGRHPDKISAKRLMNEKIKQQIKELSK